MKNIEWIEIGAVEPHPNNPRVGFLPAIKDAIARNGWHGTIVVQRSTGFILAGNHRWMAAKELGLKRVAAHYVDVDDATARRILLADNRTSDVASYNDPMLSETLAMIIADEEPEAALKGTGYSPEDATQLALALEGGGVQEWGSQGSPEGEREVYATTAIRQLVIIMSAEEYERVIPVMQQITMDNGLDTFSDAFMWLLTKHGPIIETAAGVANREAAGPGGGQGGLPGGDTTPAAVDGKVGGPVLVPDEMSFGE